MNKFFKLKKLILQTLFLYIFFITNPSVGLEKLFSEKLVSGYFSGIISLQNNEYQKSYNFFKNLDSLEDRHLVFSKSYLETLVLNSKMNEVYHSSILLFALFQILDQETFLTKYHLLAVDFQKYID